MQISRHWRMNANRYRLEGFTMPTGQKSLQPRTAPKAESTNTKIESQAKTESSRVLTAA